MYAVKILVIEDDKRTMSFIARGLTEKDHVVDVSQDGLGGLELALNGAYDVIVLDRMLPGLGGIEIVRALRDAGSHVPVLMLTALGSVEERVEGLESGADDYLVKPFAFVELVARLNAIVRRPPAHDMSDEIKVADLVIDVARRKVMRAGRRIDLTQQEFRLLEYLARRAGEPVTRTMIIESLWGGDFDLRANIVDAHLSRLRAKIDKGFPVDLLRTVRGVGYLLDDQS